MSFNDKRIELSEKFLDAIDKALDAPGGKNPEYLERLATAFALVSEHGRGERVPKAGIRKI